MSAALAPEEELLVLCSRIELDAEAARRLDALLGRNPEWERVERLAGPLGVEPLLHRHLGGRGRQEGAPAATRARLEAAHHVQSVRGLRLLGQAGRIVDALEREGLRVLLLKGALLAGSLYPDPALRPMTDIDLLCCGEELALVRARLEALGFSREPRTEKSAAHERLAVELGNHLPALVNAGGVRVELHHQLFSGLRRAAENLRSVWDGATAHEWRGRRVPALAPEDQLAYLAHHLHRHLAAAGPLPLYWWCDLHELVRAAPPTFGWERFLSRVDSLGIRAGIGAVLGTLARHWGTPVPERLLRDLGRTAPPIDLAALVRGEGGGPDRLVRSRVEVLSRISAAGGPSAVVAFLAGVVWPSRAFIMERYRLRHRFLALPYRLLFAAELSVRWLRTALSWALRPAPRDPATGRRLRTP